MLLQNSSFNYEYLLLIILEEELIHGLWARMTSFCLCLALQLWYEQHSKKRVENTNLFISARWVCWDFFFLFLLNKRSWTFMPLDGSMEQGKVPAVFFWRLCKKKTRAFIFLLVVILIVTVIGITKIHWILLDVG